MGIFDLFQDGVITTDIMVEGDDGVVIRIPNGSHCYGCEKLLPPIGDNVSLALDENGKVLGRMCDSCDSPGQSSIRSISDG